MSRLDGVARRAGAPPGSALMAGGYVGLFLGAVSCGVLLAQGEIVRGADHFPRAYFAGFVVLGLAHALVVLPAVALLRRRETPVRGVVIATVCAALIIGALVLAATNGSIALALSVILIAAVVCAVPAFVLAPVFAQRRSLRRAVVLSASVIAVVAAIYVLLSLTR